MQKKRQVPADVAGDQKMLANVFMPLFSQPLRYRGIREKEANLIEPSKGLNFLQASEHHPSGAEGRKPDALSGRAAGSRRRAKRSRRRSM